MKTVFLDFDGVLFDTLKEAFLLCRYAFLNLDIQTEIDEKEYELFSKFKFLVYDSWHYYYLMKTLFEDKFSNNNEIIKTYKNYLNNRDIDAEQEFEGKYYSKRKALMTNNKKIWNKLEEPFEFFFEIKNLYDLKIINPVIVSQKNFNSIKYRLEEHNLFLKENKIFGKEQLEKYENKATFISKYLQKKKIERAIFVDDNSNNFKNCDSIKGLETMLAAWGNTGINEKGYDCSHIINSIKIL